MKNRSELMDELRNGPPSAVIEKLDLLLKDMPTDAKLLSMKGLALAMSGRVEESAQFVYQAIRHEAKPGRKIQHASNLAQVLAQGLRWDEVSKLAELGLPSPRGLPASQFDSIALENLCSPLLRAGKHEYVSDYLATCLDRPDATWPLEHLWLTAAFSAGRYEAVLSRVDGSGYRWGNKPEANALACSAAVKLERVSDARRLRAYYLAAAPAYVSAETSTQVLSILLISPDPKADDLTSPLIQQHFGTNFPSQLKNLRSDRYRFFSVFRSSKPVTDGAAAAGRLERAITVNNCVNAERLKSGQIAEVEKHERAFALPVINPVSRAIRCTRPETAELLSGIPNLVVPKIVRFQLEASLLPDLPAAINGSFSYPVILRSVGEQQAQLVFLAQNDADVASAADRLMSLGRNDVYVIQFVNIKHRNAMHRRMRAAFVEGKPTLMRADYDSNWVVKGRKTESVQAAYRSDPSLLEHADSILRRPELLGQPVWDALAEVGRRFPLDVFGLDFDVDSNGQVVFFEANATMNLLSNAPAEIDYPIGAQNTLLDDLDQMLLKRSDGALH